MLTFGLVSGVWDEGGWDPGKGQGFEIGEGSEMRVRASGRARFTSVPLLFAHACAFSPREDPQPGDFQAPSMGLREGAEADALREPLKQARPFMHYSSYNSILGDI